MRTINFKSRNVEPPRHFFLQVIRWARPIAVITSKLDKGNMMHHEKKVLAIASGGGHWKQLMLLRVAFSGAKTKYVTTIAGLPEQESLTDFYIVRDCNKNEKLRLLITFFQMLVVVFNFRPDVVITTGAAPGLLGILCGRLSGAKTIWIDSIANAEQLSMGGRLAKRFAHQVLTQWEQLAVDGVEYKGEVF